MPGLPRLVNDKTAIQKIPDWANTLRCGRGPKARQAGAIVLTDQTKWLFMSVFIAIVPCISNGRAASSTPMLILVADGVGAEKGLEQYPSSFVKTMRPCGTCCVE